MHRRSVLREAGHVATPESSRGAPTCVRSAVEQAGRRGAEAQATSVSARPSKRPRNQHHQSGAKTNQSAPCCTCLVRRRRRGEVLGHSARMEEAGVVGLVRGWVGRLGVWSHPPSAPDAHAHDLVRQARAVGGPWEPRGMPEHRLRTARQLAAATRPGDPRCQVVVVSAGDIPAGGTQPFQTLKHQNTGAYAAGEAAVLKHGHRAT